MTDRSKTLELARALHRAGVDDALETAHIVFAHLRAEGMAVVPREPTPEMLRDGAARSQDFYTEKGLYPRTQAVWKAMLAAALPPSKE